MTKLLQKLAYDALGLPLKERADLAARLIQSLDSQRDSGVEAAWKKEVGKRVKDFESGNVKAVPWEKTLAKARKILQ